MYRTASVVGIDTLFQVSRESDVFLFRKYFATDEVYVKHFTFLKLALLRQGFRGQPRSNLASAVFLAERESALFG